MNHSGFHGMSFSALVCFSHIIPGTSVQNHLQKWATNSFQNGEPLFVNLPKNMGNWTSLIPREVEVW